MPPIVLDGTTGITTPGLTNTGTETLVNLTTTGNTILGDASTDTLNVGNGGLIKDASGNVGIGVTPSAWAGGYKASQVVYGALANNGGAFTSVNQNCFYDGSNWKYIINGNATQLSTGNGTFQFNIAASGTAGNAITFTQAMTLDASGNLALGTTSSLSPSSGRIDLTINGTSSAMTSFGTGNTRRGYFLHDATDLTIASETAGSLRFLNNGSERARIDSSGNLLVGTTSAVARIGAYGSNADIQRIYSTQASSASYTFISMFSDGATPSAPTGTLRVNIVTNGGIQNYSANNVNLSDRREKTNFAPAKSYLDVICAIPVQTFNYIDQNMEDDPGLTLGVVAQDVQAVAPELVSEGNWASKDEEPKMRLSIYQTDLQYALMKCIQEQQAIIQSLTARITALENK